MEYLYLPQPERYPISHSLYKLSVSLLANNRIPRSSYSSCSPSLLKRVTQFWSSMFLPIKGKHVHGKVTLSVPTVFRHQSNSNQDLEREKVTLSGWVIMIEEGKQNVGFEEGYPLMCPGTREDPSFRTGPSAQPTEGG